MRGGAWQQLRRCLQCVATPHAGRGAPPAQFDLRSAARRKAILDASGMATGIFDLSR